MQSTMELTKDEENTRSEDIAYLCNNKLTEKSVYTVEDVQKILDIGKNQAYALVKKKPFVVHEIGKRMIIPIESFNRWLNSIREDKK